MFFLKYVPLAILQAFIDFFLSPILFPRRHIKLLKKVNMPEEHKQAALECFKEVAELDKQVSWYKFKAPFVMAWLVHKLKWEDEVLPEKYSAYDNEISMNGDRFIPCPLEDNEGVRQSNYYLKGYHPRSKEARFVWLGMRNRASKFAFNLGVDTTKDTECWGDIETSGNTEGVLVRRMGKYYEVYASEKINLSKLRIGLPDLQIRTRYGYKIGNAVTFNQAKAMLVTIPFSVKQWKNQNE